MTPDIATRLRELADLRAAAKPGKWVMAHGEVLLDVTGDFGLDEDGHLDYNRDWDAGGRIYDEGGHSEADAAYIAATGSLTPAQLRAVADVVEAARRMTDVGETFGVGFVRWVGQSRHEFETRYDGLAAALAALDQAGGKE